MFACVRACVRAAGDRGGVSDLIQTIKSSKIPVICICNDKWSPKLRSLRGHCLELDFRAPTPAAVRKRMQEICQTEGLRLDDATLEALAKGANSDLRLILGQLQMLRLTRTSLSYEDLDLDGKGDNATRKDAGRSPFDCARRYANGSSGSGPAITESRHHVITAFVGCWNLLART